MSYQYIKNYQDNEKLIKSYFEFTQSVFEFDLAHWRDAGHWGENYILHSLMDENRVIANISASIMKLQINGDEVPAVQFGSVGVLAEYRGHGLARILTEHVLEEYQDVPLKFLFADEEALGFYSKMGFRPINEIIPILDVSNLSNLHRKYVQPIKINIESEQVKRLLSTKLQRSSILDARDNSAIYWFHLMYGFRENVYYIPEKDVIFLARYKGDMVSLYDILAEKPIRFEEIQEYIVAENTNLIRFYFTPDWLAVEYETLPDTDNNLHVLGNFPDRIKSFKFPITSHT